MLSLNINKLRSDVEERDKKKIKIFENILEMCYQKILNTNKKSDDYNCTFIVPNVVFGLPLYNIGDCITFVMDNLVKKGFEIYFALPTTIHISWKPEGYINKKVNIYNHINPNQLEQLEYYNSLLPQNQIVVKYNGSNNGSNINTLSNKNIKYKQNHNSNQNGNQNDTINKHYKSIDEYRELSNTIYNLDDLDIFQNKVDNLL
jgi:hypothetical protein